MPQAGQGSAADSESEPTYSQPTPRAPHSGPVVVYKNRHTTDAPAHAAGGGTKAAAVVGGLALAGCLGLGAFVALSGSGSDSGTETAIARVDEEPNRDAEPLPRASDTEDLVPPEPVDEPVAEPVEQDQLPELTMSPESMAQESEELHEQALAMVPEGLQQRVRADNPTRWSVYTTDGKILLQGRVDSQQRLDEAIVNGEEVLGEGNVISQHLVDPNVVEAPASPVYVEQAILYEPGSAVLTEDFTPLLDLGVIAFAVNPNIEVTFVGHTDNEGSAEANLALSQARIDAAIQYFADGGADTSRLYAEARGESEPIASNETVEGRAQNRRLEMIMTGLVDN